MNLKYKNCLSLQNRNYFFFKSKLLTEELEQHVQTIRNLELNKTELIERNKTFEKLVKELEWQLHEQEAVKNAR